MAADIMIHLLLHSYIYLSLYRSKTVPTSPGIIYHVRHSCMNLLLSMVYLRLVRQVKGCNGARGAVIAQHYPSTHMPTDLSASLPSFFSTILALRDVSVVVVVAVVAVVVVAVVVEVCLYAYKVLLKYMHI